MQVTTPGSSANLGAGFDCLALAVGARFTLSDVEVDGLLLAEERHPATVAHRHVGGDGPLWWRSSLPPGRGLGFSGAARVAGAALGLARSREAHTAAKDSVATGSVAPGSVAPGSVAADSGLRRAAFLAASELEGHPENAAASAHGGFVICSSNDVVTPVADLDGLQLLVWYPERTSSTDRSRRALPATVAFADAVHNLASAAAMVSGLLSGDRDAVRLGTSDRLHEDLRLADHPLSLETLSVLRSHPSVWGAWLSGSGPTVAALVPSPDTDDVASLLSAKGVTRVLDVGVDGLELS